MTMYQISFYVPKQQLEIVKNSMFAAGAGRYKNYEHCAWQTPGVGQFKPIEQAQPAIGKINQLEQIEEYKVEMVCTEENLHQVIKAMKKTHPYEEVAYAIIKMHLL
jgi:hypothetical protein